jgi:uncharacterized protein (TIGR02001 family)
LSIRGLAIRPFLFAAGAAAIAQPCAQAYKKRLICGPADPTGFLNAMFDRGSSGCEVVRLLAVGIVLSVSLAIGSARCAAADRWGGSLGITSDYFVRGISRSNDRAALQLDLYYLNTSGFVVGLFASNTQINPAMPSNAELDVFLGFAWTTSGEWQGKILASHYAYPWNKAGSGYNYDELDVDLAYQEWLHVTVVYSPNAPRFSSYRGLIGVMSESAEVNLQHAVLGKLSATAGIGYSYYGGLDTGGYGYWSVGAAYNLAPVSLILSYVNTTAGAKALFYNAAADGRWTGTVVWRF